MQKIGKKNNLLKRKSVIITALVLAVGIPVGILASQQTTVTQQHASQFNDLNTSFAVTQTNNPDGTMGPVNFTANYSNTFPDTYLGNLTFQVTDPPQAHPTTGNSAFGLSHNPNIVTSILSNIFPIQSKSTTNQTQNIAPTITPGTQVQDANITITPTVHGPNDKFFIPPPVHWQKNMSTITPGVQEQNTNATISANSNLGGDPQTVTSLNVSITKVEVHLAHIGLPGSKNENITPTLSPAPDKLKGNFFPRTNQEVNKWETLNIGTPQTFDLVQLANSHVSTSLGNTKLVNGKYTEMRLYIGSASAILQNGTQVSLVIPGKSGMVRVVHPFSIDSSKSTSLTMDFDAQNSVIQAGNQYILKPVVANMIEKDVQ